MAVIVDHGDSTETALDLQSALYTLGLFQSGLHLIESNAQFQANGNSGQGIVGHCALRAG